ncbi:alpha/beta hydrolase [Antrihabitans sp. YC3-6]|uniref:Alpha/beta hydrolase n=1 Tax=Antrihabitans stalagmiti TaxID=2799499 RepID=A0A934NTJ3_9NOCA|nr:alpha/beta hydrolase [Antrihabitans stalagmiti]MBJ8341231.1 alpha/beta hydrolase [Antrihabitans stalagmiti]
MARRKDNVATTWSSVATQTLTAGGIEFPYRELGPRGDTPVVFLTHLAAVLDNWDPRIVDGVAATRHVITFDNRGVGAATGKTPTTIEEMAADAVKFIRALGHDMVDLFGFSMGGMIAQIIAETDPGLVRRLALAGTGPAGGEGIDKVTAITYLDTFRSIIGRTDPKEFLFFTRTAHGRKQAAAFLQRLAERTTDRDEEITISVLRRQLKAIHGWGARAPQDLSRITIPVLLANGDHDRMVPTSNTYDMDRRFPNSRIVVYPDAGHGGVFQEHETFVPTLVEFLSAP